MENKMLELSWGQLDKASAEIELGLAFNVYLTVENISAELMERIQAEIKEALVEKGITDTQENAPIDWTSLYMLVSTEEPMKWFLNVGYLYPHESGAMDFSDVCLEVSLEGHEAEIEELIMETLRHELFNK